MQSAPADLLRGLTELIAFSQCAVEFGRESITDHMDKPITVSFRWSAQEMLQANKIYLRYSKQGRSVQRWYIGALAFFVILGIARLVWPQNFVSSALTPFCLAAGLSVVPFFIRRAVLKRYAKMPDRDMVVAYEFTNDSITVRNEIASSTMLWRAIARAQKTPAGFLLFPADQMFHWLPIHGFNDPAEIEQLAQLLKANIQQYDQAD